MKTNHYVIITGGRMDDAFANSFLEKAKPCVILAADSGMEYLKRNGKKPNIIIGDFDSVNKETLSYFESQNDIIFSKLNPIKDDTDTEYAIRYAISQGAEAITILGGTGSRLDHVLGNISLLGIGLEETVDIELLDANNRIRMIDREIAIKKMEQFGSYVSLIPYGGPVKGLTLKGAKYPLENADMGGFNSLGVSNEILDDEFVISLREGYLLVIESKD